MKSGITVVEAKRLKKKLEENVLLEIKIFEGETGCSVKSIDFECNQGIGHPPEIVSLFVECGL